MHINPRTITVSEHHLRDTLEVMRGKLKTMQRRTPKRNTLQNAYLALGDAFNASNPKSLWVFNDAETSA